MRYSARRALRIVAGLIVLAALCVFASLHEPAGEDIEFIGVNFSAQSGFYEDEFYLTMSSSGGTIHYTLDSSDPDENSPVYTGPILIKDASENENVYSMITSVSEWYGTGNRYSGTSEKAIYEVPEEPVDKATVVRAVSIDAFGNKSRINTGVYFVGYDDKDGYDHVGVVSIVTDPKNLFDDDTGIYVTGNANPAGEFNPHGYGGNYYAVGLDWSKKSDIVFFGEDHELLWSGSYDIRTQGSTSRSIVPKSLNLFWVKGYGSDRFSGEILFGTDRDYESVNLFGGASSVENPIYDWLANELTKDLSFATRIYKPYAVFLDGEYWGLEWLTQRFRDEYFSENYGTVENNVVLLKGGARNAGILAVQILAGARPELVAKLAEFRQKLVAKIEKKDANLQETLKS